MNKNISKIIGLLLFLFFIKTDLFAEINSYVKVKYESVTLWDIAPDLVDKNKGEKIILGKIIVPGGKYFIKQNKVKAELYNLGIKNQNIPSLITVERDFVEINTSEMENKLLEVLKNGNTDFDYSVSISTRDSLRMPTGDLEYRVEEPFDKKLGKKNFKAVVYEENQKVYEFPFTLNTGKLIKEYVLTKDVQKGEKFNPDYVSVKTQLVYEDTKLKNLNVEENSVFAEDLLAGTKLQLNNLEVKTLIKKGDKINVEANYGGLKITDKGEALSNGNLGQEIEIKNLRTGKTIKAVVVGENIVEIIINE